RQRRHPPNALLRYVQGLPTGQENTNPGAVPQDRLTQLCQRADRALAGVQEQQCALCPQSGDDRLGRGAPTVLHRVQTVGDRPQDLVVGGGLTQIDEACTVRKTTQDTLGHVQGQAGLADSPRTGQCDHPGTAQETSQVDDVAFTTDEPDELTGGQGQVVARVEHDLVCSGTGATRRFGGELIRKSRTVPERCPGVGPGPTPGAARPGVITPSSGPVCCVVTRSSGPRHPAPLCPCP